jgi:hypothetical protein
LRFITGHDVAVAVDHDLDDESPAQQAAEQVTPADSDPVRDERVVDAVLEGDGPSRHSSGDVVTAFGGQACSSCGLLNLVRVSASRASRSAVVIAENAYTVGTVTPIAGIMRPKTPPARPPPSKHPGRAHNPAVRLMPVMRNSA